MCSCSRVPRALREWFAEHRSRIAAGRQTHLLVNPCVVPEGGVAKATSTYFTLLEADGKIVVASSGLWVDELVRCDDGQWRIKERTAIRVMPPAADA